MGKFVPIRNKIVTTKKNLEAFPFNLTVRFEVVIIGTASNRTSTSALTVKRGGCCLFQPSSD